MRPKSYLPWIFILLLTLPFCSAGTPYSISGMKIIGLAETDGEPEVIVMDFDDRSRRLKEGDSLYDTEVYKIDTRLRCVIFRKETTGSLKDHALICKCMDPEKEERLCVREDRGPRDPFKPLV